MWCVLRFSEADNWIRAAVHDACCISYSTGETMPSDECRRRRLWKISRYSKIAFASATAWFERCTGRRASQRIAEMAHTEFKARRE